MIERRNGFCLIACLLFVIFALMFLVMSDDGCLQMSTRFQLFSLVFAALAHSSPIKKRT